MQYIKLINFVNLCSDVFLRLIDEETERYIDNNDRIIMNITGKTSEMFNYYMFEEISKYRYSGSVTLFFNACRPSKNWRYIESQFIPPKYMVTDESLLVNSNKLEIMIDNIWNRFLKDKHISNISIDEIDTLDTCNIITKIIGNKFVSIVENNRYHILCDGNNFYHNSLHFEIPDYLLTKVETNLHQIGII